MKKILLFITFLLLSISFFAQNSKLKELEQQRKLTLREISNTDKLLRDTKKTTSNLLNRIKLISNQIAARKRVIALLNQEVESINVEQDRIESEIALLEIELKGKQKSYAKAIDGMLQNRQSENKLLYILSGKSLTESYRRMLYLKEYSEWRSKQANDIKGKSNELNEKKIALAKSKTEKQALLGQREVEQNNLVNEENNYQQEITEAKQKQKDLQKILIEKKNRAAALDKQIANLIAEEVARQERAVKAADKGKSSTTTNNTRPNSSKAPTTNTNTSSEENITLSGNFASNKGKLPYPITGNSSITGRFGTHRHSQWDVTTSSNGVDIESQPGAEARAVFQGEVSRVVAFPGYNNCVIIRHGNYYTFYGNIQSMYVKQGDKVKTGQSLGRAYTDPDTNTSQLHFQLWKGTNKLNPEPWLK